MPGANISPTTLLNPPDSNDLYQIFQPLIIDEKRSSATKTTTIPHRKNCQSRANDIANSTASYPLMQSEMSMVDHEGSATMMTLASPWNLSPSASRKGSGSAAAPSSASSSDSAPPSPGSFKESPPTMLTVGGGFQNPHTNGDDRGTLMTADSGFVDVVPFPYPPRKNVFIQPGSGMRDVPMWLKTLRLHKYTSLFQQISYEDMLNLDEGQLERQGVTKGARHKIVVSVRKLRQRTHCLKQLETDISDPVNIRRALDELKSMITTPIRPYPPPGRPELYQSRIDGIDLLPEQLDDENIPAHFTRVLGKMSAQIFAFIGDCTHSPDWPAVENEQILPTLLHILDRCINHEAFTQAQKCLVISWKQAAKKMWQPILNHFGSCGPPTFTAGGGFRGKSGTPPHQHCHWTLNNNRRRNSSNHTQNPSTSHNVWNQRNKRPSQRPQSSTSSTSSCKINPDLPKAAINGHISNNPTRTINNNDDSISKPTSFFTPQQINHFMVMGGLRPTANAQLQAAMLGILNAAQFDSQSHNNENFSVSGGYYEKQGADSIPVLPNCRQQHLYHSCNQAPVDEVAAAVAAYSGTKRCHRNCNNCDIHKLFQNNISTNNSSCRYNEPGSTTNGDKTHHGVTNSPIKQNASFFSNGINTIHQQFVSSPQMPSSMPSPSSSFSSIPSKHSASSSTKVAEWSSSFSAIEVVPTDFLSTTKAEQQESSSIIINKLPQIVDAEILSWHHQITHTDKATKTAHDSASLGHSFQAPPGHSYHPDHPQPPARPPDEVNSKKTHFYKIISQMLPYSVFKQNTNPLDNPIAENLWQQAIQSSSSSSTSSSSSSPPDSPTITTTTTSTTTNMESPSDLSSSQFLVKTTIPTHLIPTISSVSSPSTTASVRNVSSPANLNAYNFSIGSPSNNSTSLFTTSPNSLFTTHNLQQQQGTRRIWTTLSCNQQGTAAGSSIEGLSKSMEKLCQSVAEVALVESSSHPASSNVSQQHRQPTNPMIHSQQRNK